ncbi:MAG: OmpA family protein [Bacteroidetes bacterium]|nr:OmpA family protein [Bacteroidota bacterium]
MNKLTFIIVFVFLSSVSLGQDKASILFDSDSYRLTPFQTEKINVLLSQLNGEPCSVTIFGHTDSDASNVYNIALSKKRTTSVKQYIIKHYPNISILKTAFFGEQKPINKNENNNAKAQNRRVEITRTCSVSAPENEKSENIWPLLNQIQPTPTNLHFDGADGGAFNLKNGARICIAPNTFPKGQINLHVSECVTIGDAFAYGLTTQSNQTGDGLQSSGMYRLQAFQNGRLLPNLKSNDITIYVPVDGTDYKTFDAVIRDQYVEWETRETGDDTFIKPYVSLCELTSCPNMIAQSDVVYSYATCRLFWCKVKRFFSKKYKKEYDNYVYSTIMRNPNFQAMYLVYQKEIDEAFGDERAFAAYIASHSYTEILQKMNELFPRFTKDVFYAMQMPNYSWVNCDRFTNFKNLTTITINETLEEGKDIRLYFKKLNCVMRPNENGLQKSKFNKVPVGQIATLVIVKRINDVLLMSSDEFHIGDNPKVHFKPIKTNDLKQLFLN